MVDRGEEETIPSPRGSTLPDLFNDLVALGDGRVPKAADPEALKSPFPVPPC